MLKIGPYALNQPISDYPNARKVSLLGRFFGSRKSLPGETPYDGGKIELLESNWTVNLGIYQNRIIRISASWVSSKKEIMEAKFCELVKYCEQRFEWDRPDCSRKDIKTWQTPLGVVTLILIRFQDEANCALFAAWPDHAESIQFSSSRRK